MLCEKCGKNAATTHIRTVVNGVVKELNLCSHCAKTEGYSGFPHNSLAGMLASMLGDVAEHRNVAEAVKCPVCGMDFHNIVQSGKVGCAECYKTFEQELLPYLKRVHGSTRHVGKIPNSAPLAVVPEKESVEDLRLKLNRLVSEEKYEEAAVLRDKIKKMEAEKNE